MKVSASKGTMTYNSWTQDIPYVVGSKFLQIYVCTVWMYSSSLGLSVDSHVT